MKKSLPIIGVLNSKNKKHIYENPRPICYAFYQLDFKELVKSKEILKIMWELLKLNLIFIDTLFYRDKLVPIAKKYPNVKFVICDENEHEDLIDVRFLFRFNFFDFIFEPLEIEI